MFRLKPAQECRPDVKALYPQTLPKLSKKMGLTPVEVRASAALNSSRYEQGVNAISGLVQGVERQLLSLHQSALGKGEIAYEDSMGPNADGYMANAILAEMATADTDPAATILARTGVRFGELIDRYYAPLACSEAWAQRSAALLDAIGQESLTPAQKLVLEPTRRTPRIAFSLC